MGNEAVCEVDFDGVSSEAKVLLETDELIVRSPFRLRIPFASIKQLDADDDRLRVRWDSHVLSVAMGREAKKWAAKIRNPKTLVEKLGVKAGQKISIVGRVDEKFIDQLQECGVDIAKRSRRGSDVIFVSVDGRKDLDRLVGITSSLAPDGAVWVIRPKGSDAISESEVMAAGKSAGLVDVKVARFSPTRTAEKFVIRVKDRAVHPNRG